MMPLCPFWCIWRECNDIMFMVEERLDQSLKDVFIKLFFDYDRIPWGFDLSLWDFIIVGFVYLVCTQLPLLLLLLFPSPIKKKIVKEENYVTCLLQCMIFLSILYVGKACFADLYLCNLNGISTFIKVSSSFFLSLLVNCCCSSLGESGILTSFSCLLQDYQMHVAQLH